MRTPKCAVYIFDNVNKKDIMGVDFYTSCFVDCSAVTIQILHEINEIIGVFLYGPFKRSSDVNEKPSYTGMYQKGTVSQNLKSHINKSQRSNYIYFYALLYGESIHR